MVTLVETCNTIELISHVREIEHEVDEWEQSSQSFVYNRVVRLLVMSGIPGKIKEHK